MRRDICVINLSSTLRNPAYTLWSDIGMRRDIARNYDWIGWSVLGVLATLIILVAIFG
jgi:hypothetical protein